MNAKIKMSYLNYLFTDYQDEEFEAEATGYKSIFYDEGYENNTAAFNDRRGYRGYASRGEPGRRFVKRGRGYPGTSAFTICKPRCLQCGQLGYIRINCLQQATSAPPTTRPMKCLIYRGFHFMRQCIMFDDVQRCRANCTTTKIFYDAKAPNADSKPPARPAQSSQPNPQTSSSFFGKNASMTCFDLSCYAEKSADTVLPSLKFTPGNQSTMLSSCKESYKTRRSGFSQTRAR